MRGLKEVGNVSVYERNVLEERSGTKAANWRWVCRVWQEEGQRIEWGMRWRIGEVSYERLKLICVRQSPRLLGGSSGITLARSANTYAR